MRAESIYQYVYLGTIIRYFQDAKEGYNVFESGCVVDNINNFFSSLRELKMSVTYRYSSMLLDFKDELEEENQRDNKRITKKEAEFLRESMDQIRKVFEAEVLGVYSFVVTDKRYELKRLLDSIELIFIPETFEQLPSVAQYDFQEAGRCIAFERATAAAFHILRATEDVLRIYYRNFTKKEPSKKTWGNLIFELRKNDLEVDIVTINHLDNLGRSFRNPTQHPDKIYEIQEVQDLLGVSIDVVNRMIKEINNGC